MGIVYFWGHSKTSEYACFSQWYGSAFKDKEGHTYANAEQYMMYQKAALMGDAVMGTAILAGKNPKAIKAMGRKIKNFDEALWNKHKETIVFEGNLFKFSQNKELQGILLATKDSMIAEASPYDFIWGIGLRESAARNLAPEDWPGENLLGKQLMKVRDSLSLTS
ncbi:DUF1768-domain-containing protein [Hesseltinella vesiculosa]|uniref:DUF1768-domain-containing protein n=1 Tax=Hesseltinella vesiculosa TaxID=101127 RepID=A0A1X2GC42_9FUNG|nr:DUF1768-domain-containing protein [Hesseltinella vesiculosa]